MENSEETLKETATPGQRLREARERAGISAREMADRLNWLAVHVTAIEEDRYESLRSAAFVRGYLRAYGRELGIDSDELVASFDALIGRGGQLKDDLRMSASVSSGQGTGFSVLLGVAIAALVVLSLWWQSRDDDGSVTVVASSAPAGAESAGSREKVASEAARTLPAPRHGESTENIPEVAAVTVVELAQRTGSSTDGPENVLADNAAVGTAAVDTAAVDTAAVDTAAVDTAAVDTAAVDTTPTAVPEPVATPAVAEQSGEELASVQAGAPAELQFEFSGDCWLEVRDGSGALIHMGLQQDGDTVSLEGSGPFAILAGDATVMRLDFRGEPWAVQTRPGRKKAEFTVGEQ